VLNVDGQNNAANGASRNFVVVPPKSLVQPPENSDIELPQNVVVYFFADFSHP